METQNNNQMSPNSKTYTIDSMRRLIDLNGDQTNFRLEFTVSSENKEPFEIVVLDQTTLDSQEPLNYKRVESGTISGNVVADKNVYQNYFMILRAEKPVNCTVTLNFEKLPYVPPPPPPPQPQDEPQVPEKKTEGKSWLRYVLIAAVVIGGIMLIYYFYKKSQENKESEAPVVVPAALPPAPKVMPKLNLPKSRIASRRRKKGTKKKVVVPKSPAPSLQSLPSSHNSSRAPSKNSSHHSSPAPSKHSSPASSHHSSHNPTPASSKHSSPTPPPKKPNFTFGQKPNKDLINRLKGLPVS